MAYMAGIDFKNLSTIERVKWIIDTGATNHMVASLDILSDIEKVKTNHDRKVQLSNGRVTMVSHIGNCKITDTGVINNVLYIPDFKHNLLSVSMITRELKCFVSFYPDFCLF